jgi:hypothetical protein
MDEQEETRTVSKPIHRIQCCAENDAMNRPSQRDKMHECFRMHGPDADSVIRAYAEAERRGEVERKRNERGLTAEEYAAALWADAIKKGWL